jgi:hypothetical protein
MAVVTQGDIERLPGGRTGCPECTVAAAIHHQERRPEGIEVVLFLLLVIAATVLGPWRCPEEVCSTCWSWG